MAQLTRQHRIGWIELDRMDGSLDGVNEVLPLNGASNADTEILVLMMFDIACHSDI